MSERSLASPEERLVARLEESFHGAYLTLVSIIQGLALAILIQELPRNGQQFSAAQWIMVAVTVALIAIVWQEYLIGSTAFAWIPTILDSTVPFLLGIAEALVILQIRVSLSRFLGACFFLAMLGVIAYVNYLYQARRGLGDSQHNAEVFRTLHRSGLVLVASVVPSYGILWFASLRMTASGQVTAISALAGLFPVLMFARIPVWWNRVIRRSNGVWGV